MAGRLYALGRWAARRRRLVLAGWLLFLVVVGGLGTTLSGKISSDFSVPGIESQQAQDLLKQKFPEAAGGVARVVFAAPDGKTLSTPAARKAIAAGLKDAAAVPGVIAVTDPATTGAFSQDRTIAYADVHFRQAAPDVTEAAKEQLSEAMEPARAAGMDIEFGGSAESAKTEIGGLAEVIGVVAAFVVLAVTLGSLLAAGLPLVTALIGVGIGVMGVRFFSRFVEMTNTATVLALMVGLAVGIDYALFIVSRHREQLADPDMDIEDSLGRAVATAGSAVAFAGVTVVVALAALSATGIPFLTIMGLAAAATVLIAVFVALTLVPAVLAFAGERMRPRPGGRSGRTASAERKQKTPGAWGMAWARTVMRAPVAVLLIGILGLLVLALPVRHLRLGLPSNETQPVSSTQHRSYDLLSKGFGPGFNATLAVVIDASGMPPAGRDAVVAEVSGKIADDAQVTAVAPPNTSRDKKFVVIGVVPKAGPDAPATTELVNRMRDDVRPAVNRAHGSVYVAGATAAAIDISAKLSDALPLFIGIIVLLALILLTIAFRSVLVPLKAVIGFLLSIAAGLGAVVWVFQFGDLGGLFQVAAAAPVTSFLPVLLIGVLFGLAMDYEVFLVSRMREHFQHTGDAREAIAHGMARSGRVVSAAALIMAAVFGGFIFSPDPIIKSIGFALTFGVLIDAFVVRMTLVPAAMTLLGRRAWALPGWLDRIVPDVDMEGAALPPRETPAGDPAGPQETRELDEASHRG